jgi:hypothetical protein
MVQVKVPGKLFFMVGFYEGDPCPGKNKEKQKMANRIPDPGSLLFQVPVQP